MKKLSVLILNRWNDAISCYENYIDHNKHNVWYITNKQGALAVNTAISDACTLDEISIPQIDKHAVPFLRKINKIDKIIALSEVDQEAAAYLRSCFYISGLKEQEIQKFRNKVAMKKIATQAGILVPRYSEVLSRHFQQFLAIVDFPLILKPKDGVSSEGVIKIKDENDLTNSLQKISSNNYECEEFIDGKIYHADGLICNNDIVFFKVSEYINTCFDYTLGKPLGSVVLDDLDFESRVKRYSEKVLQAFSLNNSAFHLEFIVDKNDTLFFLELGARVGGAKVPYLFEKIFGINLIHAWIDIQLENDISVHLDNIKNKSVGGWLLFPEPQERPCKVINANALKGKISSIIEESLPISGHVFKGNGEYRDTSGSYLFEGRDTNSIKTDIQAAIQNFHINTISINQGEKYVFNNVKRQTSSSMHHSR